jgi:hypothetical protein
VSHVVTNTTDKREVWSMAIAFQCECGKEFNAKNELAGKRARCPQCRREFRIPNESSFARIGPTTSVGPAATAYSDVPPVMSDRLREDILQGTQDANASEPLAGARPAWRDPILLYGGGIPLLILLLFVGYVAWPQVRNFASRKTPRSARIANVKAVDKRKVPSAERMIHLAEIRAEMQIRQHFLDSDKGNIAQTRTRNLKVWPSEPSDPQAWFWRASADITVIRRRPSAYDEAAETGSSFEDYVRGQEAFMDNLHGAVEPSKNRSAVEVFHWESLFKYTPEGLNEMRWAVIRESSSGDTSRYGPHDELEEHWSEYFDDKNKKWRRVGSGDADGQARSPNEQNAGKGTAKIPDDKMPLVAEKGITLYLDAIFRSHKEFGKYKILNMEVVRAAPDERKIPWLWLATATVNFAHGPDDHTRTPTSTSMVWVVVFRVTDEVHRGVGLGLGKFECWREVTDVRTGQKFRKHAELSEWTKEFRSIVSSAWLKRYQQHDRETRNARNLTAQEKLADLQEKKEFLAEEFNISTEELQEILESTD